METYRYKMEHRKGWDEIIKYCKNKNVLHYGFTDWPKTNPDKSFHLKLAPHAKTLDGYDINKPVNVDSISVDNGTFYWLYDEIPKNKYDVILCREVIEHVDNIRTFLEQLDLISGKLLIQTPDVLLLKNRNYFGEDKNENNYFEKNHQDHNYWFSTFTLLNCLKKYSKRKVLDKCWVNNHSLFVVLDF